MVFQQCDFDPATFLFLSPEVPALIYYSHTVSLFAALAVALFVFIYNPKQFISVLFLIFASLFSAWAFLDMVLWATNDPGLVMFSWSIQVLIEPLIFGAAFYLFYVFLYRRMPSKGLNSFVVLILLPLVVLLPTNLNLEAVYLSFCESEEGPLAQYYSYFLNLSFVALILWHGIKAIPSLEHNRRRSAYFFIAGITTFLLAFNSGNLFSSFTDDWTLSQYGLFGMPIFASLIAYSIVQFKTFNIQTTGAQVLVVVLWGLTASLLVVQTENRLPITIVTLIFTTIAGYLLIRSVQIELRQKMQLEETTNKLERANLRLKELDKLKSEFVSVASHQMRSPLTAIRGYVSLLIDGSYGKMPAKSIEPLERISESSRLMANAIEDYLNVSRIESGNMNYNLTDFNLREEVDKICDDLRPIALKQGLVLLFRTDLRTKGVVHADIGKTQQIIHNLINNSIKYTKRGTITVFMHDKNNNGRLAIDVIDTGVGMSEETMDKIFSKFQRADGANQVNNTGTGLGLYVAQRMAEAMGGNITASSEGEGKGSKFTLELPLCL